MVQKYKIESIYPNFIVLQALQMVFSFDIPKILLSLHSKNVLYANG